ncbi:MAG: LysO family transporter [Angelakisella sp.]|nr:LysO family transporter [Angelakisella sp.]
MNLANFAILGWLLGGILIGATIFPRKWLGIVSRMVTLGVILVLFCMGLSLGGSPTLVQDLTQAGWEAVLFAAATIAGSVAVVALVARLFFSNKEGQK